jgi:mRNA-degrading endonuclease RelE of RelBE toxin-antitoxin system
VASKRNEWKINKISNSARKNIEALESETQTALVKHLDILQKNPFQGDIKKVEGKKNIYRGRIGNIRYYFRLLLESRKIEILFVKTRSRIKKKTIQRLI